MNSKRYANIPHQTPQELMKNQDLSGVFCCLKPNESHNIAPFITGSVWVAM